jgi:glycosyltransferase involved in cell wall biosynthesis
MNTNKALTLSIIIPVFNESGLIKNCLDSISSQTIMPDEVIIVDNNSIDDTIKIAKKYKFVKVVNASKQGIVYARDKGFNSASSVILGRIDADSILPNNWVETVLEFFADPHHLDNFAWTSEGYWYNLQHIKYFSWFAAQVIFRFNRLLLGHYPLWGSSMAISAKSWNQVKDKICERNDIHEDLDISVHLHQLGYQITYATGIKVGVFVRRLFNDRDKLWKYLMLWPMTLRAHKSKKWIIGYLGALTCFAITPFLIIEQRSVVILKSSFNQ